MNIFIDDKQDDNHVQPSIDITSETSLFNLHCKFDSKLYSAEINENQPGRHKLIKVTSNCEREKQPYKYEIFQGIGLIFFSK